MNTIARITTWTATAVIALTATTTASADYHRPSAPDASRLVATVSNAKREFVTSLKSRHQWPACGANLAFYSALSRLELAACHLDHSLDRHRSPDSIRQSLAAVRRAANRAEYAAKNVRLSSSLKRSLSNASRQVAFVEIAIRTRGNFGSHVSQQNGRPNVVSHSSPRPPIHSPSKPSKANRR